MHKCKSYFCLQQAFIPHLAAPFGCGLDNWVDLDCNTRVQRTKDLKVLAFPLLLSFDPPLSLMRMALPVSETENVFDTLIVPLQSPPPLALLPDRCLGRDALADQPGDSVQEHPGEAPLLFTTSVSQDIALMLQGNASTFEPSAGELLADEPGQTTLLFGLENDALMPMEKGFSLEGLQPEMGGETLDMVSRGFSQASNLRCSDSTNFSEAVNRAEGTSTRVPP